MKNIILTGSSSGFGMVTAKVLAQQGHAVYATMRNVATTNAGAAATLLQWAADNHSKIYIVELDVTSDASVATGIQEILAKTGGRIDVLINNAGSAFIGLNETLSASQCDHLFQINVVGVDRMIKAVLPSMHERKEGLLVTLSSITARMPVPVMGSYAATKAAVDTLSVSYHYELRSAGIDVAIVQPGAYPSTDIVTKQMVPANPGAERYYGADMLAYKENVFKRFTQSPDNPDPKEVAEVIAALIDVPQGERPLWSIVRGGPLTDVINQINQSTKQMMEVIMGHPQA